jgi:ectoine hydroxylase-related dioxygenase (phytanoyl-CoA dioxygenase family)
MMTAETPVSLALLDRIEAVATAVFGGPVIPTRAKGTRYRGESPWHTDSDLPLRSVGCLAYLEPVGADSGALRVIPGSHHPQFREALRELGSTGLRDSSLPAHVVATEPGDLLLLDEHVLHASFGGGIRRQWRVDYLGASSDMEVHLTKSYFAGIYELATGQEAFMRSRRGTDRSQ